MSLRQSLGYAAARVLSSCLPREFLLDRRYFTLWERQGYHVTRVTFGSPVPDSRTLGDELWSRHSQMPGIELDGAAQLARLDSWAARFRTEYEAVPTEPHGRPGEYQRPNGAFEAVDAEVLYCLLRDLRPRRMIEIGSGWSTLLAAQALSRNAADEPAAPCEFTAIEPHPRPILLGGRVPGLSRLIECRVQEVPLSLFGQLDAGDVLFIDSSHVAAIGSDVLYEILEILPRLRPGVFVHFHDIFLPANYPRDWVKGLRIHWNEQWFLQAFLCLNPSFEVVWAGHWMHMTHPDRLEAAFPAYRRDRDRPGSFWIRRVA